MICSADHRSLPMPFLQLTLEIGSANPESFEDTLFALGASAVTLHDAADSPILEPGPGATPLWPTVILKALFDESVSRSHILEALENGIGPLPPHQFEDVQDRVWEREWLKDFRP